MEKFLNSIVVMGDDFLKSVFNAAEIWAHHEYLSPANSKFWLHFKERYETLRTEFESLDQEMNVVFKYHEQHVAAKTKLEHEASSLLNIATYIGPSDEELKIQGEIKAHEDELAILQSKIATKKTRLSELANTRDEDHQKLMLARKEALSEGIKAFQELKPKIDEYTERRHVLEVRLSDMKNLFETWRDRLPLDIEEELEEGYEEDDEAEDEDANDGGGATERVQIEDAEDEDDEQVDD